MSSHALVQLVTPTGELTGPQLDIPLSTDTTQLQEIVNSLLHNEEPLPYSFYVQDADAGDLTHHPHEPFRVEDHKVTADSLVPEEMVDTLDVVVQKLRLNVEKVVRIVYQPQAWFRVRMVSRCANSLAAHTEAVLVVRFSPDSQKLITGSGDTTVRLWDLQTGTVKATCAGHKNWVLMAEWSPDNRRFISGGMDNELIVWDGEEGKELKRLKGHKKWITAAAWEPHHLASSPLGECTRVCTSSKDHTLKVWNVVRGVCERSLSGHTMSVTAVVWSGMGLVYSASQDRTIKCFDPNTGSCLKTLNGHAHWVNTMSLSTGIVLRTGCFDHKSASNMEMASGDGLAQKQRAQERWEEALSASGGVERLCTGSDDFTLFLWASTKESKGVMEGKPVARMTGHQGLVNVTAFSPDGRWVASASFDKSVKVWDGHTGKFYASLRGHVGPVYQVAWSADSRMLVTGSKDSTLKVFEIRTKKCKMNLPGHADEVYSVDWSADGFRVASGSKDRIVKIWHH